MRALVVGAGAVGQVFGRHLFLGGAHVAFYVKPRHVAACREGFTFYPLNQRAARRGEAQTWTDYDLMTTPDEVAEKTWDQVYLTVSSTALRGEWLAPFLASTGDATVVLLQPGLEDRAFAEGSGAKGRLVQGMISLISYPAPLPGETRFPGAGMAYWFPLGGPSPMSGPAPRRDAVIDALRAGGLPAKARPDVARIAAFPTATMMPLLVALESAGWSFHRMLSREHRASLTTALAAAREARALVARRLGARPPFLLSLLARPFALRAALAVARWIIPMDLEAYLELHFTKVGDQTRALLAEYIDEGKRQGATTPALESLMVRARALCPP